MREEKLIEGAQLLFKNFSGVGKQFNDEGKRNFCLLLSDEDADELKATGWNVRPLQSKFPDEPDQPIIQVAVRFDKVPPKIVLIKGSDRSLLNEETVSILDWAELDNIDLVITASPYTMYKGTRNEKSGIKAYVKSLWATLHEDPLEKKYARIVDSGTDAIGGCGYCDACDGTGNCKNSLGLPGIPVKEDTYQ